MKNDWKILQILIIILIIFNGYDDYMKFITSDESIRFPLLISFILAIVTLITGLFFFLGKQKAGRLLGVLFFIHAGLMLGYVIIAVPYFSSIWYLVILNLIFVYLEILVGKNLVKKTDSR
ncbi:hypothetical protein [Paenibacillus sp. IHBB 10380]|uniref:hypothetical protein n=1 Tax=Paenibacillus sp. IHBB 10380 TaxID=1566358 RepID=UPI0005CFC116|nr:hypothetical protein [Paenibacillus sp. IHBB 10380]AJS58383.1 hypothetical protein UB51_07595 [Paenibacillus sp. IHBB 10380]